LIGLTLVQGPLPGFWLPSTGKEAPAAPAKTALPIGAPVQRLMAVPFYIPHIR
jgi:hypothetical protein